MKKSLAIDTLRYAKRLEEAGVARPKADAMADALNDELVDHQLTKADLAEALQPIHNQLAAIDQRFASVDARFEAADATIDSKFNQLDGKIDSRFNELDGKIDSRFNELDGKIDAKFDALNAKIDAKAEASDARFDAMNTKIDAQFKKLVFGSSIVFLAMSFMAGFVLQQSARNPPVEQAPVPVEQPAKASAPPLSSAESPP